MGARAFITDFLNESFTTGQTRFFDVPQNKLHHYDRLTILVAPRGTGDPMTVTIRYKVGGIFTDLKNAIAGIANLDEIFPFTTEDIFGDLEISVTAGTNPPTGDVDIQIFGWET